MLHYFLAALLLAAAAQGYRQFEIEESPTDEPTTPDPPVDDTEMETKVTVMESPSNVTFKEAARYLPMRQRVSAMQSGLHVTNQYGGGGGGSFIDYREFADVAAIVIRSGSLIDSIKLVYRNPDGSTIVGDQHGGNGGGQTIHNLAVGEFVFAIHGRTGALVDSLSFITNYGRVLGPHGGNGGGSFSVGNCRLRGIYGRSGSLLDAIGFVCKN